MEVVQEKQEVTLVQLTHPLLYLGRELEQRAERPELIPNLIYQPTKAKTLKVLFEANCFLRVGSGL